MSSDAVKISVDEAVENNNHTIDINAHSDTNTTLPKSPGPSEPSIKEENGEAQDDDRPSKRRKLSNGASTTPKSVPTAKFKPISPPWKKVAAEGPTSFTQDGRRKSGRVNSIPIELDTTSSKRHTRGTYKVLNSATPIKDTKQSLYKSTAVVKKPPAPIKNEAVKPAVKSVSTPKQSTTTQQSPATNLSIPEKRSHKKGEGKKAMQEKLRKLSNSTPDARVTEPVTEVAVAQTPSAPKIRIRFKVNVQPPLEVLPVLHPGNVPKSTSQFNTAEQFFKEAGQVPLEAGGLFSIEEDANVINVEQARAEAKLVLRLEEAVQDDGILSRELSRALQPDYHDVSRMSGLEYDKSAERKGPLRQYAQYDHLLAAAIDFRSLMTAEASRHRRHAKQLAYACKDEWLRRQPKSEEQLAIEAYRAGELRYKSVMKSLQGMWENVRIEINNRRVKEWQHQEQVRVRRELDEAVDLSAMKLEARRARSVDSLTDSEEDEDESESGHSDDDDASKNEDSTADEDNMSSSESEVESIVDAQTNDSPMPSIDKVDDEEMTVEELKAKYANVPEVVAEPLDIVEEGSDTGREAALTDNGTPILQDSEMDIETNDNDDGTSDESIDMSDDMGESDEEDSDDDVESSEEDESEEGEQSLLGFFSAQDLGRDEKASAIMDPPDLISADTDISAAHSDDAIPIHTEDAENTNLKLEDSKDEIPHSRTEDHQNSNMTPQPEPPETNTPLDSVTEMDVDSETGERSSMPTPNTSETKQADSTSASSLEIQQISRAGTPSTPQFVNTIKTPVPPLLRGTLREYQHYGLDWLAGLYATKNNGILADEMGLGKTIQTIALLAHLACTHHIWGTHLVVVPTSVILNWEIEFKKFCPGFKILSYYGSQDERRRKRVGWNTEDTWNVVITSYQVVVQDHQVFRRRRWHYMILDEAHNIKNFKSKRWQTLLQFNTQARLLLTGTPLQNNLTELWSLLFFLMPGDKSNKGFASLEEYSDWFRKPQEQILENGRETMTEESRADIAKLHTILRPYLLRRLKADVEKQMPGKFEHVEWCRLSRRQRELYDGFLSTSSTRQTLASGNYMSIIGCLMQLRKVCNHPDLFDERPIMTSFPMKKSLIADYEVKDLLVRRRLLREHPMNTVSLRFLNMVPTENEGLASSTTDRSAALTAQRIMMDLRESQRTRAQNALFNMDPASVQSNLAYLESSSRWGRFEELQHCVYLNALRRQQKPIYGSGLVKLLTMTQRLDGKSRPRPLHREKVSSWMWGAPQLLQAMTPSLQQRSDGMRTTIQKFACVTPRITTPDALPIVLARRGLEHFQSMSNRDQPDAFHEARMKLSIQFPDKRLLQYDCGKLQTLDKLLRKLQAGGHRALIFTQMTKVLDILEQFLNIHGHRYLRLDGSTKIEHRQVLTDRFNNDTRILAFILSSRSGGMGINLTGADTVIFYDMDWNPAMDKQCQDRAHRIGQTRDVHIYRLVSEHTIEANILRKANQKRMLDDVVIQEGEFTTEGFQNRDAPRNVIPHEEPLSDTAAAANAAMDRVLGGATSGDNFAQAEDQEDVDAAKVAQQEVMQADADDFEEKTAQSRDKTGTTTPITPVVEDTINVVENEVDNRNFKGETMKTIDDYMLLWMADLMKDTPIQLPKDKRRDRHGRRDRAHRAR